jgi:hypothetical protein
MSSPPDDPDLEYHAITLTADETGTVIFGKDSQWVGFQDKDRRIELRRSRLVDANYRRRWETIGAPYIFVVAEEDLPVFLLVGGHALIERKIAEQAFGPLLEAEPVYPSGESGFKPTTSLSPAASRRAPTPKLRMQILQRDRRRCRICGRYPDDDVDLVLHVHHIRPWEKGGVTEPENLITLCHTCHSGLDPHYDPGLFEYVQPRPEVAEYLAAFSAGVANYRRSGLLG